MADAGEVFDDDGELGEFGEYFREILAQQCAGSGWGADDQIELGSGAPLGERVGGLGARGDWQADADNASFGPGADFTAVVLRLDDHGRDEAAGMAVEAFDVVAIVGLAGVLNQYCFIDPGALHVEEQGFNGLVFVDTGVAVRIDDGHWNPFRAGWWCNIERMSNPGNALDAVEGEGHNPCLWPILSQRAPRATSRRRAPIVAGRDRTVRESLALALFALFFAGTLIEIALMLGRKRRGLGLERFRLVFFFMMCLMLVCLVPLWIFAKLTTAIWVSDLTVALANLIGLALTYTGAPRGADEAVAAEEEDRSVRAYAVYFQGNKMGMVTREGFEQLLANDLLKQQRTVELVDNYEERARRQGLKVLVYQNRDGSQRLIKVEGPEG